VVGDQPLPNAAQFLPAATIGVQNEGHRDVVERPRQAQGIRNRQGSSVLTRAS
jgi:hypothetical protein